MKQMKKWMKVLYYQTWTFFNSWKVSKVSWKTIFKIFNQISNLFKSFPMFKLTPSIWKKTNLIFKTSYPRLHAMNASLKATSIASSKWKRENQCYQVIIKMNIYQQVMESAVKLMMIKQPVAIQICFCLTKLILFIKNMIFNLFAQWVTLLKK